MARDAHEGDEIVGCRAGDTAWGHAAIAVAIEHPAFAVHGDFVKVEKVTVLMAAALLPDAGHALNGIVRGGVDRRPGHAAVVGGGDERIPFAREAYRLVIARDIGAREANGRAAGAAAYCLDLRCVLDAVRGADVEIGRASCRERVYSGV